MIVVVQLFGIQSIKIIFVIMESIIPVICETEDFKMLPNGDILGLRAYDRIVGVKTRRRSFGGRRKNRDRVVDMRVGIVLFRSGVLDF